MATKKPIDGRSAKRALETPAARRRARELATPDSPDGPVTRSSARALLTKPNAPAPQTSGRFDSGGSTPDSETGQVGTPGTLNTFGYITGEDYNQDLDGFPMFPFYNKMRLSDAQVNATQLMLKLPLKGARWIAKPASGDPQDLAIADFVQHVLIDGDISATSWQRVLDNALLKFDFGSAAEEIVWGYDDTLGAAVVKDMAPRLPRTFYRWVENPKTGQLDYLQQFAPKNGMYGFWNIHVTDPVTNLPRLQLHVRNREGNNYYGRSVLRTAYPHWWWKQQLYRIGMVGADREHAGIARAKLGEKYQSSSAPIDKIETTLKGMRTHDRAYLVQPFGVEYDWLTSSGTGERMRGLVEFIDHHNMMIARNILQSFAAQGEQRHGSFGAASVTADVYFLALAGEAREIGAEHKPLVKALCDLNFDMRGRQYPILAAADLKTVDIEAIANALGPLASTKLLTPDDDLENWLRNLFEAPPLPEQFKGQRSAPVTVPGTPQQGDPAPDDAGDGTPAPASDPADTPPSNPELALGRYEEDGRVFSRQPNDFERRVFDLHGVPSTLDDAKAALARQLTTIRLAQLKKTAAILAKKDARPTAAFTDLRKRHLPKAPVTDYVKAIRGAQTRMFDYGRQQVAQELKKQGAKIPKTLAAVTLGKAGETKRTAASSLVSSAQVTGDRVASAWQSRILDRAIQLRRQGVTGADLEAAIVKDLQDEAESGASRDAGAEVNEAFGIGRANAAQVLKDLIESATYSAVLDTNTCDPCGDLDGQSWDDLADAVEPPNPDCDGRDSCRCVLLFQAATPSADSSDDED